VQQGGKDAKNAEKTKQNSRKQIAERVSGKKRKSKSANAEEEEDGEQVEERQKTPKCALPTCDALASGGGRACSLQHTRELQQIQLQQRQDSAEDFREFKSEFGRLERQNARRSVPDASLKQERSLEEASGVEHAHRFDVGSGTGETVISEGLTTEQGKNKDEIHDDKLVL